MANFPSTNNQQVTNIAKALSQVASAFPPSVSQQNTSLSGSFNTVLPQATRITASSSSSGTVTIPIAVQGIVSATQTPSLSVLSSQRSGTVLSVTPLPQNQQKILAAAILPSSQGNSQLTGNSKLPNLQLVKPQILFRHQTPRQIQAQQVVQQIQLQRPQQSLAQQGQLQGQSIQQISSQARLQFISEQRMAKSEFDSNAQTTPEDKRGTLPKNN